MQYSKACYQQIKEIIYELHKQAEIYKNQPPKIVFKQHFKFSQFLAPLLGGNCKTCLFGAVRPEETIEEIQYTAELLNKAKAVYVPVVKVSGISKQDLNFSKFRL